MNTAYGYIDQNGNLVETTSNAGITGAGRSGTGRFWVTFAPGFFNKNPVVLATVATSTNVGGQSGTNRTISVSFNSVTRVEIGIRVASESNDKSDDRPFYIYAIGSSS